MEGRVRVLGRAPAGEPAVRPLPEIGGELDREPRLPNPGLARDDHHLALAGARGVEALLEQPPLVLPPDEGSEARDEGGRRRGERARRGCATRFRGQGSSVLALDLPDEAVAAPAQGLDPARPRGRVAERVPELLDGVVDALLEVDVDPVLPESRRKLLARHHLARALDEQCQGAEGLLLEPHLRAPQAELPGAEVGLEEAKTHDRRIHHAQARASGHSITARSRSGPPPKPEKSSPDNDLAHSGWYSRRTARVQRECSPPQLLSLLAWEARGTAMRRRRRSGSEERDRKRNVLVRRRDTHRRSSRAAGASEGEVSAERTVHERRHLMKRLPRVLPVLAALGVGPFLSGPAPALTSEERVALRMLALPDTTVTSVRFLGAVVGLPARCRVLGTIETEIRFELLLPATSWNGKLYHPGGGGFVGSIPTALPALGRGYATVATDTGHS